LACVKAADIPWTAKDQNELNAEKGRVKECFFPSGGVPRENKFLANLGLNFGFDYTCILKIVFYIYT
jgi:hypothetical protein